MKKDRIAVLHFYSDLFCPALSAIADGAGRGFLLGRFLPAQNGAWWTCFPTAEQAKRRKEANELPSGFQEAMRSDSQGSGRRVSRDNVSTRVSGKNDWSDVAAADARFLRPELPKKEVPGAMVALVDPVDREGRGGLSTSPPGKGLSTQKKRRP